MDHVIEFQPPNNYNARRTKFELLEKILNGLAASFRTELSRETAKIYMAALANIPPELLQEAIVKGLQQWVFFPSLAEILVVVRECPSYAKSYERARENRFNQYELA
jgi:hypothetical protein